MAEPGRDQGGPGLVLVPEPVRTAKTPNEVFHQTVSITDNDAAGVTITPSGGSTAVTEAGATVAVAVLLTSVPAGRGRVAVMVRHAPGSAAVRRSRARRSARVRPAPGPSGGR